MRYMLSAVVVLVLYGAGYASSPYKDFSPGSAGFPYDEAVISDWLSRNVGFEENLGQVADMEGQPVPEVLYRANLPGYSLFLTEEGLSVVFYQREKSDNQREEIGRWPYERLREGEPEEVIHYARFDLIPVNATISKERIVVEEPVPGESNYYLAHCPEGVLGVRSYSELRIQDVYPGVDWVLRVGAGVHHEFVVEPGADWEQIRLKVKWADVEVLDGGRKVRFHTRVGDMTDGAVVAWEEGGNQKVPVEVMWKEEGERLLGFEVKGYRGEGRLVIDPPLELGWATYYGGSGSDGGYSIAAGPNGNVFVTGWTYSTDFPTYDPGGGAYYDGVLNDSVDLFLLKFTNDGVREWATYYGGSANDWGNSIAVGPTGHIFVTGGTSSSDFPAYDPGGDAYYDGTYNGSKDLFLLKFTNDGVREWATYYGGSDYDEGMSIAVGPNEIVFVTGYTRSSDFPTYDPGGGVYYDGTHSGGSDAFLLKFTNVGVREWATYYGGSDRDKGYSIAVGPNGNVFVTGTTWSSDFPTYDPGGGAYYDGTLDGDRDIFLIKFVNQGVRGWATYYGGSGWDGGNSIAVGPDGNVFVTGYTNSGDFPTYDPGGDTYYDGSFNGGYCDMFLVKFTNEGVREWASFYGGSYYDEGISITVGLNGNVFVTGGTTSSDFPTYDPGDGAYYDGNGGGDGDAFFLKFTNEGVREWATFYGGSDWDRGSSIAVGPNENVFVTGHTVSSDFPTYDPGGGAYYDGSFNGGYDDVFVLKFNDADEPFVAEDAESRLPPDIKVPAFFSDRVEVRIAGTPGGGGVVVLQMYDVAGRRVAERRIARSGTGTGEQLVVIGGEDVRRLPAGVYLLKVSVDKRLSGVYPTVKIE